MSRGTNWRTPAVVLFCGGLILMLALGTRQSFGLFLRPMTIDLGCGREVFSFAIALQNLVWGLGMPVAGAIADRYGAGRVLTVGGLAYGLGLLAMAHSTTPLELDATAGLLIGLGLACTGFGVVLSVVARAFPPGQRSFAVGITGACGSIGQFVMLPGGQALISGFGWVNALITLGALAFLIIPLGAALAGRNAAAQESEQSIGEALAEAMAHRGFWLLTASFFVCGFQTIFVMTHLPAYAVDRGLTSTQGMTALATIGFFNIIGSTAAGALGGRYSKKWILFWLYVARALAIAVYLATPLSATGTYLFAAVLGLTWLATVPLTNSLVGQIFGVKFLSTLFSLAFLGHQLGAFIGAWAGGAIFDATGSYQLVWLASIALSVVAAALCVPIDERTLPRPVVQAAA
ncbi:MAG: MFS transporter [Betaproteobacteria bacterium]|nr:MAG: MFS transporter [Betaproteobacteria bacterium]